MVDNPSTNLGKPVLQFQHNLKTIVSTTKHNIENVQ